MSFQWLQMRIGEEKDRRGREAQILDRLPGAIADLHRSLSVCVDEYNAAFGPNAAAVANDGRRLAVTADGRAVELLTDPDLPGFRAQREAWTLAVQIGVLPGDRLFYFDVAADQYLSMEELTRRILDRVLFPKLQE